MGIHRLHYPGVFSLTDISPTAAQSWVGTKQLLI
jgi:hypothetical protein